MMEHTAYLSIGSNVGDKKKNLENAVDLLNAHESIQVDLVSSFYQTQPQNYTDQDWFVNAALKIKTTLLPHPLLAVLQAMEKQLDKEGKPFRFGPRIIDLDIVYYDDKVIRTEDLEIPHPRMHERCFVLVPLCDIGADAVHPVLDLKPGELLNKIEIQKDQEVFLLDEEA